MRGATVIKVTWGRQTQASICLMKNEHAYTMSHGRREPSSGPQDSERYQAVRAASVGQAQASDIDAPGVRDGIGLQRW